MFVHSTSPAPESGPLGIRPSITTCKTVRSVSWNFFPARSFFLGNLVRNKREGLLPNSAAVAQYLPFLRRYARALTGSQASGDAYVAATLEALIADRTVIEDPRGPRVALYRLFTKIWNSVAVNGVSGAAEEELPGEHKLANITPLPRQSFLLVALEGFSEPDAARVLDIDVTKLRGLVEESGRELAA